MTSRSRTRNTIMLTLMLVLAGVMAVPSHAQSTITVGAVSNLPNRVLPSLNYAQLPLTVGSNQGTAWIDATLSGGFIVFHPSLLGSNTVTVGITGITINSRDSHGRVTSATYAFECGFVGDAYPTCDPDGDGDSTDTVQGSFTIEGNYTLVLNRQYLNITGGSGTVYVNN